jgi:tRNA1(Val) A37 N6-methylase TrmN6
MAVNEIYLFEQVSDNLKLSISKKHRFGTDALLLAEFSEIRKKDSVCDLCSGCGIIPILIKRDFSPREIWAVEIQNEAYELMCETKRLNNLDEFHPVCADLNNLPADFPRQFDVITCNPPYKKAGSGILSEDAADKIARFEIMCNIGEICKTASNLLKDGGRLCLCNRPERLADVISAMKDSGIEPKRLRFVHKNTKSKPWLFLIDGTKGGRSFLNVAEPLFIKE